MYCGSCGQKQVSPRLTLREIGHDLLHAAFHVDRSVLSLIRMLLVRPGIVALDYVQGRTNDPNVVAEALQTHINLVMFAQVPLLRSNLVPLPPCRRSGTPRQSSSANRTRWASEDDQRSGTACQRRLRSRVIRTMG